VFPAPRPSVVLYRTPPGTALLTTLATTASPGGVLHAHGPVLHGRTGAEAAATIEAVARSHGSQALVWDGDSPIDLAGVNRLVAETAADLLVVEWHPEDDDRHNQLARALLADPPCDILLVRPGELASIQQVVVAAGEGPNAPTVAGLGQRWAEAFGVPASVLRAVTREEDVAQAVALCRQLAPSLSPLTPVGGDLLDILTDVAARSGFLALGAAEGLPAERLGERTLGGHLTRRVEVTIVVGRSAPDPVHSPPDARRSSSSETRIRRSTLPTIVSGSSERNS
jgi:hypothetical protein